MILYTSNERSRLIKYKGRPVGGGCAANPLTMRGFIRERLGLGLWCEGLTGLLGHPNANGLLILYGLNSTLLQKRA